MKFRSIGNKLLLPLLLLTSLGGVAQRSVIPDPPNPPRLVNDFAGVLGGEASSLESKLEEFARNTSNQIAVVTVNTIGNYDIAKFTFDLGNKWGIGQEKMRNGILIVVKPKTATESGEAFIATGKGLEGAIPDATCYAIVNKEMIPYFKNNDYYGGIDAAVNVLMALAKDEYNSQDYAPQREKSIPWGTVVLVIIVLIIIFSVKSKRGTTFGGGGYYRGRGFFGGYGGGSFSGRGGGFGGGFGGFGGGSFGGGGAGGRW